MKQWMVVMGLVFCMLFSAQALAEESESINISPTETQVAAEIVVVENQTNTSEFMDVRIKNNTSPGFIGGLGLGYSYLFAIDYSGFVGYDIIFNEKRSVGFGLYANLHGMYGIPTGLDADLAPTLLVTHNRFRFSFGLGFGVYDAHYKGLNLGYDDDEYVVSTNFILNPSIKFHWFVSEHVYLGFGIDVPLVVDFSDEYPIAAMPKIYFSIGFKDYH